MPNNAPDADNKLTQDQLVKARAREGCTPLPILRLDGEPAIEQDCSRDQVARKLYEDVSASVVKVHTPAQGANPGGEGSGFFVGDGSEVVTAAHGMIDMYRSVEIITSSGETIPATIEKLDDVHDLAVLKLSSGYKSTHTLKLGNSSTLHHDDKIFTLGHPNGLPQTYISPGTFSSRTCLMGSSSEDCQQLIHRAQGSPPGQDRDLELSFASPVIEGNLSALPGNSGGPLVNKDGQVVGIAIQETSTTITRSARVEELKALLKDTNPKYIFTYQTKCEAGNCYESLASVKRSDGEDRLPLEWHGPEWNLRAHHMPR